MLTVGAAELPARLARPDPFDGHPLVVLDGPIDEESAGRLDGVPAVVVGPDVELPAGDDGALARLDAAVDTHPEAAVALAVLLRGGDRRTIAEGLAAESAVYALLQGGADHRGWLAATDRPDPPPAGTPVRVRRDGDVVHVTLARPERRNAFAADVRDGLLDALAVAAADPTVTVRIDGEGPVFCSGGDLGEFGTTVDPAVAHLIRLRRSAGRAVAAVAERVTVHVHGACVGAGVELAAFAGRVVADADAGFRLPELAMGLVPGAGGTVSLPRRIGRRRTAWLALTGEEIDAPTALAWGLVDAVAPPTPRQ